MPDAITQTTQTGSQVPGTRLFNPVKYAPAEAEKWVRSIAKEKPINNDLVGAELAPLFGFGPDSNRDPLVRLRTQAVFQSPEIFAPLHDFMMNYTQSKYDLPVGDWVGTLALVYAHRHDQRWTSPICPFAKGSCPDKHYARFLILMLKTLNLPAQRGNRMLNWLRDALREGRDDDVCWVLFHALMFLQLKAMAINKENTSFKDRVQLYICRVFPELSRLGLGERGGQ
ncbi:hypothetical protein F4802DRAFT_611585 [Xylaria palmicola]|nr:hypothetical protein F4802DRAFT_611585 [Xylaria palmicola]